MTATFPDADGPFHHERCLCCGTANPHSMGLHLWAKDGRVVGTMRFDAFQEGGPGHAHGGAVATVLDDALGSVPMLLGRPSVTANLNVDYRAPVKLGITVQVTAWPIREDGRKCLVAGELRTGDTLLAEATGLFIQPRPGHYGDAEAAVGRW